MELLSVVKGDYRKMGRLSTKWPCRHRTKSRHHRHMTRSRSIAKSRRLEAPVHVDPLNKLERQRTTRRSRQQAQSERIFHAQYLFDPNTVALHPIRFWLCAWMRRRRSSSSSRSGLIGATPFRSRNSALEKMSCATSAMQAPAPSEASEASGPRRHRPRPRARCESCYTG